MPEQQEPTQSRILIVEDESNIAVDLKSCVEQSGHKVLACVNSAEKALELMEQKLPDLVLMDIVLKGQMDGIEAAALIRSRWGIPVVFITAYSDLERVERANLGNPYGYLLKPIQDNEVKVNIKTVLYASRMDQERKEAEEMLGQSIEKYRSLASSIDSMYLVDRDCKYLFMNEGHRLRFGLPLEDIVGKKYADFHSEEDSKKFAEKVGEILKTDKIVYQERWSERDERCFLRTFTPVRKWGFSGELSEIVVVSKDITERKLAEQQLIDALQQSHEKRDLLIQFEKHAAIGRLVAGVAHEILNPASIILSQLQFLEEERLSEPARENLRVCQEQIQRIVKISRELRLSSAKQPGMLVGGDLRRVIDLGLQMTEPRIKKDHVQVEYHPPPEVIPVKMDSDRMVKMMVNLILNACDAMTGNRDKRMIVTVHRQEVSSKSFSIRLIVADNGFGIPAGNLNLIFEPFFTTKDPDKGTGLGLSVCKGIVQEHGGMIHSENNDMGGTSFIIELPLYHEE